MTLLESINALANEDFSRDPLNTAAAQSLYLDPEAKIVYTFTGDNSVPRRAYDGVDKHIISIPANAIAELLVEFCLAIQGDLERMIECHQRLVRNDERDTGYTNIDSWAKSELERCSRRINDTAGTTPIGSYWTPSDWFEPVLDDLAEKLNDGMSPEEIIDGEDLGNSTDGMCSKDAAIAWLTDEREELISRLSE